MKFKLLTLFAPILLAGCATQYQQCVDRTGADLAEIKDAIATTEANLERGYAIFRSTEPYNYRTVCYYGGEAYTCAQSSFRTEVQPVAIDGALEKARLKKLKAALGPAQRRFDTEVKSCQGLPGA